MGSSLSIVNNTQDQLFCIISADTAALAVFGWISFALAAVVSIALSAGTTAPQFAVLSPGVVAMTGITPELVKAIVITAVVSGGNQAVNLILDKIVSDQVAALQKEGYRSIPSGGKHTFTGLTLSLWQQGNCKRVRRFEENGQMFTISDEVFMRPIFSGATDGSNIDHEVQFWINKFGFQNEIKMILQPPLGRQSWGNTAGTIDEFLGTSAPSMTPTTPPTTATAAPLSLTMPPTTGVPSTLNPTGVPSTLNPTAQITLAPTAPFTCDVCI